MGMGNTIGIGGSKSRPGGENKVIHCRLMFMGIENIHVMRESWRSLLKLARYRVEDDDEWLTGLCNSQWLEHCSCILDGASQIVQLVLQERASVLLHCSDGWDRTPQVREYYPSKPRQLYKVRHR
jgi:hypothetical protein